MIIVLDKNNKRVSKSAVIGRHVINSYIDRVSVNLYAVQSFYIIDTDNKSLSIDASITKDDRSLFKFYTHENGGVVFLKESVLTPVARAAHIGGGTCNVYDINIAFMHTEAVLCSSLLHIKSDDGRIDLTVLLHAESEDTEDRYKVAMQNISAGLDARYEKAFKDGNINEEEADRLFLNRKREEFLIEQKSLKPFIGSYYGLINAIRFFGYDDDVFIREYWKKLDETLNETIFASAPIDDPSARKNIAEGFEKTNILSLAYKVNDFTGALSPDGHLPELIDLFRNQDEALIKLRNIRIILEGEFLPAHVYFLDVVGEEIALRNIGQKFRANDALVYYLWEHLPFENHKLTVSPNVQGRVMELAAPPPDGASFRADPYYEIERELGPADYGHIETFGDIARDRLQYDCAAMVSWRLDTGYEGLLGSIGRADYILIGPDGDEVWSVTKTAGQIRAGFSFASKRHGGFKFIVKLTDGYGAAHTMVYDIAIYDKVLNFMQAMAPPAHKTPPAPTGGWATGFSGLAKKTTGAKNKKPPPILYQPATLIDTYGTDGQGAPVVSYSDQGYDVNDADSISPGGTARWYAGPGDGLPPDITPYDLKTVRLGDARGVKLSDYGPSYVVIWINMILGAGDGRYHYIKITDTATGKTIEAGLPYNLLGSAHVWDDDRDYWLKPAEAYFNENLDGFTASVMPLVSGDGTVYHGIRLLSKGYDLPQKYKVALSDGWYRVQKQKILADRPAESHARISGAPEGDMKVYDNGTGRWRTVPGVRISTLQDLALALGDVGIGNVLADQERNKLHVFANPGEVLGVEHPAFVKMADVPRAATYARVVKCGPGVEINIGTIVYIYPDKATFDRHYDIRWTLYKDGDPILSSDSYIFAFPVTVYGALDVGLEAKDRDGVLYTCIKRGAVFSVDPFAGKE